MKTKRFFVWAIMLALWAIGLFAGVGQLVGLFDMATAKAGWAFLIVIGSTAALAFGIWFFGIHLPSREGKNI